MLYLLQTSIWSDASDVFTRTISEYEKYSIVHVGFSIADFFNITNLKRSIITL